MVEQSFDGFSDGVQDYWVRDGFHSLCDVYDGSSPTIYHAAIKKFQILKCSSVSLIRAVSAMRVLFCNTASC